MRKQGGQIKTNSKNRKQLAQYCHLQYCYILNYHRYSDLFGLLIPNLILINMWWQVLPPMAVIGVCYTSIFISMPVSDLRGISHRLTELSSEID